MRRVTSCLALSVLLVAGLAGPGLAEEPVLEDIEVPTDFVPIDDPFVLDPGATDGGGAGATEQPAVTEADVAAGTSRFVPLPPTRVLDTREGKGAPKAIVPPKGSVVLQVTGAGGVPASGRPGGGPQRHADLGDRARLRAGLPDRAGRRGSLLQPQRALPRADRPGARHGAGRRRRAHHPLHARRRAPAGRRLRLLPRLR